MDEELRAVAVAAVRPPVAALLARRFPHGAVSPLAGDASTRRFLRVSPAGGPSLVVMDYGAPFVGETDDIILARLFREADLPVAQVLEAHPDPGCLVLEDLGPETLEEVLARGGPRDVLYAPALELALAVADRGTPVLARSERAGGPALDGERFRFEMDYFVTHYVRGLAGVTGETAPLQAALDALAIAAADSSARVFCHRDFHSRNLVVRGDGSLAMVNIQDARWGPDTYDLASLLRDAYVSLPDELVESMLATLETSRSARADRIAFRERFDLVSAQRMIKALGTFGFQVSVKGKDRYREGIPRTLARLRSLLPRFATGVGVDRAFRALKLYAPASGEL